MFATFNCNAQYSDSLDILLRANLDSKLIKVNVQNLLNDLAKEKHDSLPYLYQNYATWLFDLSIPEAIIFESKALLKAKNATSVDSSFIQKSALYLGFYHERNKQPLEAIKRYAEAAAIKKNSSAAIRALERLGSNYLSILDYYKAIEYLEVATSLLSKNKKPSSVLRSAYQNLSIAYRKTNTPIGYLQAAKYGERADSIANIIPTNSNSKYLIKLSLAQLYNQHKNLNIEKSVKYYDDALEIARKSNDSSKISNIFYGKGSLYNTTDYKKAEYFLNKAIRFTSDTDSLSQYYIYNGLATVAARSKQFESSIVHRRKALRFVIKNGIENPQTLGYEELSNSEYIRNNLTGIQQLAETYLSFYEMTNDEKLIEASLNYFQLADKAIDLIKLNSSEFKSKLYWQEISANLYGKAMRACYLSSDIKTALFYMEKNKALLLMEDIATQKQKTSLNLSSSFKRDLDSLKKKLFLITNQLQNSNKQSSINTLKKQRLLLSNELLKMTDTLSHFSNPITSEASIYSLSQIQENLERNEIFIEYHISIDDGFGIYSNNENGYALFIGNDWKVLFEIHDLPKLSEDIVQLRTMLNIPFRTIEDIKIYNTLSYDVFQKLFPTEEIRTNLKDKKLNIAPDNYLSLLPFEALITDQTGRFLIQDNVVRYNYSFSFLKNTRRATNNNGRYLGLAPRVFGNQNLNPLENSENEIQALSSHFSGDSFLNDFATKETFIRELPNYQIVHLATHANAQDDETPWIAFRDEKMMLDELYLVPNHASLVVLSGCNTALGKQETGEGVMSLARGFFYGGAQSVISSLWSVDDKATAKIMEDFYNNLSNGLTKSEALHQAKKQYFQTHTGTERSPHFWSSFILLGEDTVIESSSNNYIIWIFGVFLFLLMAYFGIRKFREK